MTKDFFSIRTLAYVIVVALGLFVLWYAFIRTVEPAGATVKPAFHTEWQNEGKVKWGKCESVAACGTTEGVQTGTQKQGCKLEEGKGEFVCKLGDQRYVEVKRECKVETPACEEEGVCPTECGLESSEVADGKGGVKVCEATPTCDVPVPPVVKEDTPDRVKFSYTQGPDKGTGDEMCKLQWKPIDGSKKVEIRYATDGIFGNGYKTIMTKDDGSLWVNVVEGLFKIRGRDSKTDWSKTKELSC